MPKKNNKKKRPFSKLISIVSLLALVLFIFQMIQINLFPINLLIVLVALVSIVVAIVLLLLNFKAKKMFSRFIMTLVALCMCAGLVFGNLFLYKTGDVFDVVTSLADSKATTSSIVVMKNSSLYKEKDLKNKKIGTIENLDEKATSSMLASLKEKSIRVKTKEYDSLDLLVDALYDGKVDAICLNEKYRDVLHESQAYFNFQTDSRVVCQNVEYTKVDKKDNPSDPVSNISSKPFTILVTGNDSYGTLQDSNTRSDANLLLTVNPKTGRILMTSIPRDYYVDLVCDETGDNACPEDSKDKLTHSGLMGVKCTERTIEKALGITINYNIRINFSSVVNLVDALDGIDLDVKEGEEVDVFYANGQPGLSVGKHHVDGETALAFARERHAYMDGDNQRVRNQQKVFKAIFKRIVSPKMITNYGKFMDAIAVAFDTNLSNQEISKFVKYELSRLPKWKFESYTIAGNSDLKFCYAVGDYASVIIQNEQMNEIARKKIQAILDGKKASSVKDDTGISQEPSKDNSIGNSQELEKPVYETPTETYEPSYDDSYTYDEPTYDDSYNEYNQPDSSYDSNYSDDTAG